MTDVSDTLREKVSMSATSPGVYLMRDAQGRVVYVGKARNLKKRLASYFLKSSPTDVKTGVLVETVATFDTILTATEHEALILESNLIKRHRPRYNVILKDDKRYPILRLDTGAAYPALRVVRKIEKDDALYFGPFSSAGAVKETLKLINRTFLLRKCRAVTMKSRTRPCLHYQMNQCLAPCCMAVPPEQYRKIVQEVILFLNGKMADLLPHIRGEMKRAAAAQEFEKAAKLRDKLFALEKVQEKQVVVSSDLKDRDIIGIASREHLTVITLLFVRSGNLVGTRHFSITESLSPPDEMIASFLSQYYESTPFIPAEIFLPMTISHAGFWEDRLSDGRQKKVRLFRPQRGEKKKLVEMAMGNAENRLEEEIRQAVSGLKLLERVEKCLGLSTIPMRIECFDNSNLYGSNAVSGMVVFENGKPKKSAYRKYNIRNVTGPDDYAAMAEVLSRRFKSAETTSKDPLPNLLMVDGGRGQLNIAMAVLSAIGLSGEMDVVGIAKKESQKGETQDKIFLPGRSNPVNFGRDTDLLLFLQRVRDEAHRFAISFYRKTHRKGMLFSELDAIAGIGKRRKQILLSHFKSIPNLRRADVSEIAALPGFNRRLADEVLRILGKG